MATIHAVQRLAEKEDFLSAAGALEKEGGKPVPPWAGWVRRQAMRQFMGLAFPTPRDEHWKYTDLSGLLKMPLRMAVGQEAGAASTERLPRFDRGGAGELAGGTGRGFAGDRLPCLSGPRLVFVNGFFAPDLSAVGTPAGGVVLGSLSDAFLSHSDLLERHLTQVAGYAANIFTALNTGFLQDGALVFLPRGMTVEAPIHLIFVTDPSASDFSQPRILIIAGAGARATVVESYVSAGEGPYFSNAVTEIFLKEGASLDHYKLQREGLSAYHVASTHVALEKASAYNSFSTVLGAGLARHNLAVLLNGPGASSVLLGLTMIGHSQHVDHHTFIDHEKPRGRSRQVYKGILDGGSRGVFSGKILVRRDAQKTDAHQSNKNLLLSEKASVTTKPHLEIGADDVRCTHGAAVGQLDENALYYLASRGVSRDRARCLLTYGFANEVLSEFKLEPVRVFCEKILLDLLEGQPSSAAPIRSDGRSPAEKSGPPSSAAPIRPDGRSPAEKSGPDGRPGGA